MPTASYTSALTEKENFQPPRSCAYWVPLRIKTFLLLPKTTSKEKCLKKLSPKTTPKRLMTLTSRCTSACATETWLQLKMPKNLSIRYSTTSDTTFPVSDVFVSINVSTKVLKKNSSTDVRFLSTISRLFSGKSLPSTTLPRRRKTILTTSVPAAS